MNCITPGFPVLHCLLEFAQTYFHWVGDVIQPSCPLLSFSPPALKLSQHQSLFQWVSSLDQVAKISDGWPKYWSFSFSISPSSEYPRLISGLRFHYFFHSKNCGFRLGGVFPFLYSKRIIQRLKAITNKLASHLSATRSENISLVAGADLKS